MARGRGPAKDPGAEGWGWEGSLFGCCGAGVNTGGTYMGWAKLHPNRSEIEQQDHMGLEGGGRVRTKWGGDDG